MPPTELSREVAELRETLVTVQAEQKKAAEDLQTLARQQSADVRELVRGRGVGRRSGVGGSRSCARRS